MSNDTTLTIIGNLTADPELRFTPSGSAVANFTIASTPRIYDRNANEWKDGETLFMRCAIWREAAENAAESLTKGTRVIAYGRLKPHTYDAKDGSKRTVMEMELDEIGPSLKTATAKVAHPQRQGGNVSGQQWGQQPQQQQQQQGQQWGQPQTQPAWGAQPAPTPPGRNDDPWATPGGTSPSYINEQPY